MFLLEHFQGGFGTRQVSNGKEGVGVCPSLLTLPLGLGGSFSYRSTRTSPWLLAICLPT